MSDIKVIADRDEIVAIADAVRSKTGTTGEMTLSGIVNGVNSITTQPTIQSLSITENGTYTAPTGVDGYSPVTVNVASSGGAAKLETWNGRVIGINTMPDVYYIDENGEAAYALAEGIDCFFDAAKNTYVVVVNVDEQNPSVYLANCELVWVLGNPMGGNYAYLVKITGDNFHIEG